MFKKQYKISLSIGLILIFQIQLISYINWLLVDQSVINGYEDPYLLFKTPLIIIPILFIGYSSLGILINKFLQKPNQ